MAVVLIEGKITDTDLSDLDKALEDYYKAFNDIYPMMCFPNKPEKDVIAEIKSCIKSKSPVKVDYANKLY